MVMRVLLLLYLATAILVELIDDSVNFVFVRILTSSSERLVQLLMGTIVMMMMITMIITFVVRITVAKHVDYLCGYVTILIVVKVIKCLTVPYYKTIYVLLVVRSSITELNTSFVITVRCPQQVSQECLYWVQCCS